MRLLFLITFFCSLYSMDNWSYRGSVEETCCSSCLKYTSFCLLMSAASSKVDQVFDVQSCDPSGEFVHKSKWMGAVAQSDTLLGIGWSSSLLKSVGSLTCLCGYFYTKPKTQATHSCCVNICCSAIKQPRTLFLTGARTLLSLPQPEKQKRVKEV